MVPPTGEEDKLLSLSSGRLCRHYSLADILLATLNFDDGLVIGQGGFGKVYKGYIKDEGSSRSVVAIKRFDSMSNQGAPEFRAEIEMLSKLRHCYLVSLIGYCNQSKEMILVYEYMPHGTLDYHLHKADAPLSWLQRLRISIGAARGLDYFHTGTGIQHGIIHRDVKSSNILLDENWAAKISDFGLSKISPINQPSSYVNTGVKGTFGYLDPEYFLTGRLTRKTDVFAFGVVLFELLSGRLAVDTSFPEEEWSLSRWAKKCAKERKVDEIVGFDIKEQISPKCLKEFVQIALRCLHDCPKERPTMAEVVVALQLSQALQEKFDKSSQPAGMMGFTRKIQKYLVYSTKVNSVMKESRQLLTHDLRKFSFSELKRATMNFSSCLSLGKGRHGEVFKGWLNARMHSSSKLDFVLAIAVKRFYGNKFQPPKELDLKILGEFNHQNVVKILGYCSEDGLLLILYELMQRGTLENYLFGKGAERHQLITRVKIALGVARGLVFLHNSHPQLGEFQLQRHNILLDADFNAKLSDFDVEKLVHGCEAFDDMERLDNGHESFVIYNGDPRYSLPSPNNLSLKSDVFGFGVVLLELLTGEPIETLRDLAVTTQRLPGENGKMAMQCIGQAVDCRLKLNFPFIRPATQLTCLAQKCVMVESLLRPTLESILNELEEIYDTMMNVSTTGSYRVTV